MPEGHPEHEGPVAGDSDSTIGSVIQHRGSFPFRFPTPLHLSTADMYELVTIFLSSLKGCGRIHGGEMVDSVHLMPPFPPPNRVREGDTTRCTGINFILNGI
jgi:hypothetical protein